MGRMEQGLGTLLILIVLLDIFLTVLYARIGTSIIGSTVARLIWASLVKASNVFGSRQGTVLSFCGPIILVLLVCVWALGLTLGAALIMHPELGTSIRATNGETPTDFVTAIYAGGTSMAIVGASDFTPHTSPTRLLFLFNSLIGISVMSLTLTYLMQVYTALQRRNVLAMNIHFLSGCTGDAAELLARLGPQGQFSGGYTNLSELGVEMTQAKEAHHFYPVLFYFRFSDSYHSVSRSHAGRIGHGEPDQERPGGSEVPLAQGGRSRRAALGSVDDARHHFGEHLPPPWSTGPGGPTGPADPRPLASTLPRCPASASAGGDPDYG